MGNAKRLRTLEWKNEQLRKAEEEYFKELFKKKPSDGKKGEENNGTKSS